MRIISRPSSTNGTKEEKMQSSANVLAASMKSNRDLVFSISKRPRTIASPVTGEAKGNGSWRQS